jgi:signal peptidase I
VAYAGAKFFNELFDAIIYAGVFVFMVIRPFAIQAFVIPSGSMWPTFYVNDLIVLNKAVYRFQKPQAGDIVVFRPPVEALDKTQLYPDGQPKVDYIKRCIGVPGDLIELKAGKLFRNGKEVLETYRHLTECPSRNSGDCENKYVDLTDDQLKERTPYNFKLVKRDGKIIPFNYTDLDANAAIPMAKSWSEGPPYVVAPAFVIPEPSEADLLKAAPAEKLPPGHYLFFGDNRNYSFDGRGWGIVPEKDIVGRAEAIWFPLSRIRITR